MRVQHNLFICLSWVGTVSSSCAPSFSQFLELQVEAMYHLQRHRWGCNWVGGFREANLKERTFASLSTCMFDQFSTSVNNFIFHINR